MVAEFQKQLFSILPPCNIDAEEALLGTILWDGRVIEMCADYLVPEAFFVTQHQEIYRAALNLYKKGNLVNLTTVATYLWDKKKLEKCGGQAKLAQLVDRTVNSLNADSYARLIYEKYIRRQLIEIGNEIVQRGHETSLDLASLLPSIEERVTWLTQSNLIGEADTDYRHWQRMIDEYRKIETEIFNPSFKLWQFQELAQKYGKSTRQLEDLWMKSLLDEEDEPPMSRSALLEKYGQEQREWLMGGWVPKPALILFHAKGGVGKTRLSYNLFFHLAAGKPWSGYPVTAPRRKILVVQTDESAADMLSATEAWAETFDDPNVALFKTKWTFDHLAKLRKEILEYKPDIVLIDSLTSVSRNSLFSENDVEYARPVLKLMALVQELNVSIILIHHSSKSGDSRGSSAILNSASEVWNLTRDPQHPGPDAPERILTIQKSRSRRPAAYKLRFNPEDNSWDCLGEEGIEEDDPHPSKKDMIVEFLSARRNVRFEVAEIQHWIGGSLDYIRLCCLHLSQDGIINRKRTAPGKKNPFVYWVAGEGEFPPSEPNGGLTVLGNPKITLVDRQAIDNDRQTIDKLDRQQDKDPVSDAAFCRSSIDKNESVITQENFPKPESSSIDRTPGTIQAENPAVDRPVDRLYYLGHEPVEIIRTEDTRSEIQASDTEAPVWVDKTNLWSYPISECTETIVQIFRVQLGDGVTVNDLTEVDRNDEVLRVIEARYPNLMTAQTEEVRRQVYKALPKIKPLMAVLEASEEDLCLDDLSELTNDESLYQPGTKIKYVGSHKNYRKYRDQIFTIARNNKETCSVEVHEARDGFPYHTIELVEE